MNDKSGSLVVAALAIIGAVSVSLLQGSDVLVAGLIGLAGTALGYEKGYQTYNPDLREEDPEDPEA